MPGVLGARAEGSAADLAAVSSVTLNRISIYLRCLRILSERGVARISSQELAHRFHLSATQIRKDLACFGEFGIRGVGYDVPTLEQRLSELLGLDREHPLVIVGMGNLGCAFARHLEFNRRCFRVVGGVDADPQTIGKRVGGLVVRPARDLRRLVRETGAEIALLTVPPEAARQSYDALIEAGVRAILNFSPIRLPQQPGVKLKNVELRSQLEELAFFLRD